jgi:hypothetical protein
LIYTSQQDEFDTPPQGESGLGFTISFLSRRRCRHVFVPPLMVELARVGQPKNDPGNDLTVFRRKLSDSSGGKGIFFACARSIFRAGTEHRISS